MMIDTVKVIIPVEWHRPLFGGRMVSTKSVGGTEAVEYEVLKFESVEGSYSSSLLLRCVDGRDLELYGSPTKWLTGHNLFGSTDLRLLLRRSIDRLYDGPLAGYPPISDIDIADAKIQRIDVNEMFSLNSLEDVRLYLKVAAARMSVARRSEDTKTLSRDGNTLGIGMQKGNRSSWKLRAYAKGPECRVRRKGKSSLPTRLLGDEAVMGWIDRQLRLEYELHGRELDRLGLRYVRDWDVGTAAAVWAGKSDLIFWGDEPVEVEMSVCKELSISDKNTLKTYDAWRAGRDLRAIYSSASFKRWRSRIKAAYHVDIALPPPESGSTVVAMDFRRVLDLSASRPEAIRDRVAMLLAA